LPDALSAAGMGISPDDQWNQPLDPILRTMQLQNARIRGSRDGD
jgi:hypothetical protein